MRRLSALKLLKKWVRLNLQIHPQVTTIREVNLNTYNVTLRYEDRKNGSEGRTIKVDASSISGAIGKATRDFVKSLAASTPTKTKPPALPTARSALL